LEPITQYKLWSFTGDAPGAVIIQGQNFRKAAAHAVASYFELATKVAELQFRNRDHILLFRGQAGDYRNQRGYTSMKPTLLRGQAGRNPGIADLRKRFARLAAAEAILVDEYKAARLLGLDRVRKQRIVRWSILQHYEICATPLLDVTHSLRIAASFASHGSSAGRARDGKAQRAWRAGTAAMPPAGQPVPEQSVGGKAEAYVFVLGVPHLSGGITASAEAGLQAVRLSSVCPPSAVRPHLQEGYLLGEYPELSGMGQKALYLHHETDFGQRLIAKFRFDPATFWEGHSFPIVGRQALYPAADPMLELARRVQEKLAASDGRALHAA
jgi:hypothetical protein